MSTRRKSNAIGYIKKAYKLLKESPSPFSNASAIENIDYNYTPTTQSKPAAKTKSRKEIFSEKRSQRVLDDEATIREVALTYSKIALSAKLAQVDGEINSHERTSFSQLFPEASKRKFEIEKYFGNAANDDNGFEHYAKKLTKFFPEGQEIYENLLISLFEFGAVDGPLNVDEISFLYKVNGIFGLSDNFFYQIARNKILPKGSNPYIVLNLSTDASIEDIKRAYKSAAQEYHPDRLAKIDCAPDIIAIANERFARIHSAYEKLIKLNKAQ